MECPGLFCLIGRGPEDKSEKGWIPVFWRNSFLVIPIYGVIHEKLPMFEAIVALVITSLILKKTWRDKLTD